MGIFENTGTRLSFESESPEKGCYLTKYIERCGSSQSIILLDKRNKYKIGDNIDDIFARILQRQLPETT